LVPQRSGTAGPFGAVDPRARKETLERVEQGVLIKSGRDLASESAAIRSLEGLGLIRSLSDEDDAGLCFELPDDGAWLRFMGCDVPRLVEQGWRIEVEDGFHFQVTRLGDDWRIEIAGSEGRRWLDVGLGVDVDGERLDLLAAAPGGSGAALPGRFFVTHAGPDGGRGDPAGTARRWPSDPDARGATAAHPVHPVHPVHPD